MSSVLLGEVATTIMGQAPPGTACNKEGLGTVFVKAGEFDGRRPVIREWTTRPLKIAKPSDVLVCVVGATAGKVSGSIDCAIGRSVAAVRPNLAKLDTNYLYHFLSAQTLVLRAKSQGLAQGVITREMLESTPLSLPTIEEQRRIAAIFDETEEMRRHRRETIDLSRRLAQAVFIAEFDRPHPKLPLSQVCSLITDGTHYTPTYTEGGSIFLSAKNVTSGKIDWHDVKYIPETLHQELRKRVSPRRNDVLLAKNGTTGVAALVDRDIVFDIYVSLALLRAGPQITPPFLLAALNSPSSKKQFNSALKGIGVPNLHLKDIRSTVIPVPPLELQQTFADRIAEIDNVVDTQVRHLAQLDALHASLQHQAFRAEL